MTSRTRESQSSVALLRVVRWVVLMSALLCGDVVTAAEVPALRGPLLTWVRLKFRSDGQDERAWHLALNGDLAMMQFLRTHTYANLSPVLRVVDVANLDDMTAHPFLFMTAEVAPGFTDAERANLKSYLLRGGFLFADDCVSGRRNSNDDSRDVFFRAMAAELRRMFPEGRLERLPPGHPVFHAVFEMSELPHVHGVPHGLHGLIVNGRVVAVLSPSDIHCGWSFGMWARQANRCFQMGTNIYVFAMTQGVAGSWDGVRK